MGKAIDKLREMADGGEGIPLLLFNGINGYAWFCGAKCMFDSDGSGWLASQNIIWDSFGNTVFNGTVTSSSAGNRIVINPLDQTLKLITSDNRTVGQLSFYDVFGSSTGRLDLEIVDSNNQSQDKITIVPNNIIITNNRGTTLDLQSNNLSFYNEDGRHFAVSLDNSIDYLSMTFEGLPTSKAGLPTGKAWLDGENFKVVR